MKLKHDQMTGEPVRAVMFRVDVSGHPAKFTVTSVYRTPPPPVEVDIDGPSKVRLTQRDTAEGFEFTYIVSAEGEYAVRILCDDRIQILGSPFQATFNCKSTVLAFFKTVLYYCVCTVLRMSYSSSSSIGVASGLNRKLDSQWTWYL